MNAPSSILPAIDPHTAAMPAFPISVLVRSRLSLITGSRAAGAKVDNQAAKKLNQELQRRQTGWSISMYRVQQA